MASFSEDLPTVSIGWATIYLYPDEIVVTTNINDPASVESHHNNNPNHSFVHDEATYIKVKRAAGSRRRGRTPSA